MLFRPDGTLAYQHVAIAAMLKEVNYIGPKLGLPIPFPIMEEDLVTAMAPRPNMQNLRNPALPFFGGTFHTRQFAFSFSDNGRLCFVFKLHPWGRMSVAERNDMLAAQKSLIDTNGAYQMATNWLAQFPVNVERLERYGYATFADYEIKDVRALVSKLESGSDAPSAYFKSRIGDIQEIDEDYVATQLNQIVLGPPIYNEQRFRGVALRPETIAFVKKVVAQPPSKLTETRWNSLDDSALCNRMLLEDAYPRYLSKLCGNPPIMDHEFRWARESTNEKDYLPLFKISWGVQYREENIDLPRVDIEIDGRTKELLSLRLEDDSVSQRPAGLFKNREELLKVPDQQFLSYSPAGRKAFIEKFLNN